MKQETALSLLKQGKNIFLTGQAGAGKTYVINQYVNWLRKHSIEPAVTASTGIAATHIGGVTIHSWSGLGILNMVSDQDLDDLLSREHLWKKVLNTHILIIDEISMIGPGFLDGVDRVCRAIREKPDVAFGGIQVIFSGDFFQLPPVVRRGQVEPGTKPKRYAWQSTAWLDADIVPCYLSTQFRQSDDDSLLRILNDIRDGEATEDSLADLKERFNVPFDEKNPPIRLYTHNADVDSINQKQLDQLEELPHFFEATTRGSKANIAILEKGCMANMNLELKVGAIVMFIKNNHEKNYANGSMGVITEFDTHSGYPLVDLYSGGTILASPDTWAIEQDGKSKAELHQIPLRLAWAITIHKSQGMSLDAAEIDLTNCFEMGQGYVALSRVRSLDGLYLKGFNATATQMDPLTIRVDGRFQELSEENENKLQELDDEQLQENIDNFIEQSGGSLEEVEYVSKKEKDLTSTYEKTHVLVDMKMSLEDMAKERGLAVGTIMGHIMALKQRGLDIDTDYIEVDESLVETVRDAYDELLQSDEEGLFDLQGQMKLKPIFKMLDGEVDYDDIKLALVKIV